MIKNVPRLVKNWTKPIVIGRHAYGDVYNCTDFLVKGPGDISVDFKGQNAFNTHVHHFPGNGVGLLMFNHDDSIESFAHACFKYAIGRNYPLYMTISSNIFTILLTRMNSSHARSGMNTDLSTIWSLKLSKEREDTSGLAKTTTVMFNLIWLHKVKMSRFRLWISWINDLCPLHPRWCCRS